MKTAEEHLLIFEGASAGQHIAAGAAWVDLPAGKPGGQVERERASQYPQRSCPSEQRRKNRQMTSALRVASIIGRRLRWLCSYSPLRGCACNTGRGNGSGRFADRQTRKGKPSGSERVKVAATHGTRACPCHSPFAYAGLLLRRSPTSSCQSEVSNHNGLYAI